VDKRAYPLIFMTCAADWINSLSHFIMWTDRKLLNNLEFVKARTGGKTREGGALTMRSLCS